jgi:hypothetical protein
MPNVETIKTAIESLPEEDCVQLRRCFFTDGEKEDKQIEEDSASGRLDFVIKKAIDEKERVMFKEL